MSAAQAQIDQDPGVDPAAIVRGTEHAAGRKAREVAGRIVLSLRPDMRWKIAQLADEAEVPHARLCRDLVYEALEARGISRVQVAAEWKEIEKKARLSYHEREAARLREQLKDDDD
jgi:hypothetical protein